MYDKFWESKLTMKLSTAKYLINIAWIGIVLFVVFNSIIGYVYHLKQPLVIILGCIGVSPILYYINKLDNIINAKQSDIAIQKIIQVMRYYMNEDIKK